MHNAEFSLQASCKRVAFAACYLTCTWGLQDPYPERSIESLDLMEAMTLWLLRWGQKQNVAAEQKLVAQRQQAASGKLAESPTTGRGADAQPDTPTSVNGFSVTDAQPQVQLFNRSTSQSVNQSIH